MKKILTLFICMGYLGYLVHADKTPVTKNRDKWRLRGYNSVVEDKFYEVDAITGDRTLSEIVLTCSGSGTTHCRRDNGILIEMDDIPGYTPGEKQEAQNRINTGDALIDSGISSGTESNTVQFVNIETGASYYRTFSYVWFTNADLSVESSLTISDPF